MSQKKEKSTKLNATQKIQAMEDQMLTFDKKIDILAEEIDKLALISQQIIRRLNASIQATDSTTGVEQILLDDSIKELENKVNFLVEQKAMVRQDSLVVDNNTFVVGREIGGDGSIVNPRIQFAILSLDENVKKPFLGKRVGEVVVTEDGANLELMELYEIMTTKREKNYEEDIQDIAPLEEEIKKATKEANELKDAIDEKIKN